MSYTISKSNSAIVKVKDLKGSFRKDSIMGKPIALDLQKRMEANKIRRYEAKQEKQASYLEILYDSSKKMIPYFKTKTDGLVRMIILEYTGHLIGNINKELLGWKYYIGKNKILISSNGIPIDINDKVLFNFIGNIKIYRGYFIDFNHKKRKVHLLTNNMKILKQINGGGNKLMSAGHWQGKINFKSPSRSGYNFIGDYWNHNIATFSDVEINWEELDNNYEFLLRKSNQIKRKSFIGFSVSLNARGEDLTTKIKLPKVDSDGQQIIRPALPDKITHYKQSHLRKKNRKVNLKTAAKKLATNINVEEKAIEQKIRHERTRRKNLKPGPQGDPDVL